jgi:TetR/AcrR family transcriptional repressor of bet genes
MKRIAIRDIRREQLIEATIESIVKRGFARTTLAQVAAHAHMSHGIVSFHFKSKDDLLVATLEHLINEYDSFSKAAVEQAGSSPIARLTAVIDVDFNPLIVSPEKVTVWYAFWAETRWRQDFLKVCSSYWKSYFDRVRRLVQAVIDLGRYSSLDAGVIARAIVAMLDGLWLDILINKDSSVDDAKQSIQSYLIGIFPEQFSRSSRKDLPERRIRHKSTKTVHKNLTNSDEVAVRRRVRG